MQKITDKETPEIILIRGADLTPYDLFKLNHVYKTDRGEFIITSREADTILLNSEAENITEIKEIVTQIMEYRMMQGGIFKLLDRIEELAGGRTEKTLLWIWHEWRDARILADRKEEAERIVKTLRKERILQKAKKERDRLEILHNLGFGVYDKDSPCDWQKANAYCFAYGYWKALQDRG